MIFKIKRSGITAPFYFIYFTDFYSTYEVDDNIFTDEFIFLPT